MATTQQSIYQTLLNLPAVGEQPYHPREDTDFLQREYGKTNIVKRAFQSQRCNKWQWLHYDVDKDVAYCHTCVESCKIRSLGTGDLAFVHRQHRHCVLKRTGEFLEAVSQ